MIISHKYKFIFIKTQKTAGTSIEVTLSPYLGLDDIATPIFPKELGHIARNYSNEKSNGPDFYNHISAMEILDIIPKDIFASYYKFCVEREPVDKCLSHYSMLKNSPFHNEANQNLSWKEYVQQAKFPNDFRKYTDSAGNLIVDEIVRYEELHRRFPELMRQLGVPINQITARAKSGFRERLVVTDKETKAIYSHFSNCCKIVGY